MKARRAKGEKVHQITVTIRPRVAIVTSDGRNAERAIFAAVVSACNQLQVQGKEPWLCMDDFYKVARAAQAPGQRSPARTMQHMSTLLPGGAGVLECRQADSAVRVSLSGAATQASLMERLEAHMASNDLGDLEQVAS